MKRSKLLLISSLLGTLYGVYIILYFAGAIDNSTGAEQLGAGIASVIVMPHIAFVWLALIFNWIGYIFKLRWSALVAGILYAVSMVLFFIYFMFVVLEMIMCFVAFAKMKNSNEDNLDFINKQTQNISTEECVKEVERNITKEHRTKNNKIIIVISLIVNVLLIFIVATMFFADKQKNTVVSNLVEQDETDIVTATIDSEENAYDQLVSSLNDKKIGQEVDFAGKIWTVIEIKNGSYLLLCNETMLMKSINDNDWQNLILNKFKENESKIISTNGLKLLTREEFRLYKEYIPAINNSWWLDDVSSVTRTDNNGLIHNLRYYVVGSETAFDRGTDQIDDAQYFGEKSFSYIDNEKISIRPCFWFPYNNEAIETKKNNSSNSANVNINKNEQNQNNESNHINNNEDVNINEVIFGDRGIKITSNGIKYGGIFGPELKLTIENNTDRDYCIQTRNDSVNGYMVYTIASCTVASGKKANTSIIYEQYSLDDNGISQIDEVEFYFHIFDENDWSNSFDSEIIHISF